MSPEPEYDDDYLEENDADAQDWNIQSPQRVYSTEACIQMLKSMDAVNNELFSKLPSEPVIQHTFVITNHITGQSTQYGYNKIPSTISNTFNHVLFSALVGSSGHAFAINTSRSYVIPLMLDFDCPNCRDKIEHHPMSVSAIKSLCREIVTEVHQWLHRGSSSNDQSLAVAGGNPTITCPNDILMRLAGTSSSTTSSSTSASASKRRRLNNGGGVASASDSDGCGGGDLDNTWVVMSRSGHCGFHLYFGASVSIILYNLLLSHLQTAINFEGLILDPVTMIPLPYSSKGDDDGVYSVIHGDLSTVHILPQIPFYEVGSLKIVHYYNQTLHRPIGVYESICTSSNNIDSEWSELEREKMYLICDINFQARLSSSIDINQFKLANSEFKTFNFSENIELFINAPFRVETVEHQLPTRAVFAAADSNNEESSVDNEDHDDSSLKDAFYKLASILASTAYNLRTTSVEHAIKYYVTALNLDNCKYAFYLLSATIVYLCDKRKMDFKKVLEMLTRMLENHKEGLYIVTCLTARLSTYPFLVSVFKNCVKWISTIANLIRSEHTPDTPTLPLSSIDMCVKMVNDKIAMFRPTETSSIVYAYRCGTYKTMSTHSVGKDSLFKKVILDCARLWALEEKFDAESIKTMVMYHMDVKSMDFNSYAYFINTRSGVFNTLTSRYMASTPLLYFNTRIDSDFLPEPLLETVPEWANFIKTMFIPNQYKYFYDTILTPGLRRLPLTIIEPDDLDGIVALCAKMATRNTQFSMQLVKDAFEPYKVADPQELEDVRRLCIVCQKQQKRITFLDLQECTLSSFEQCDEDDANQFYTFMAHLICVLDGQTFKKWCKSLVVNEKLALATSNNVDYCKVFNIKDSNIAYALFSVCAWCNFDPEIVLDFLRTLAMFFCPASRRLVMLLIGPPKSGKSALNTLLRKFSNGSFYTLTSSLNATKNSSAAEPDMVQIGSSYAVGIVEANKIDTNKLKSLTGTDATDPRGMFEQNRTLKPCAFIIAGSNGMPTIRDADEAIRERLSPFKLTTRFLPTDLENNKLLLFSRQTVEAVTFSEDAMALAVFWVVYGAFEAFKGRDGIMTFNIQAQGGLDLLQTLLVNNNYVYYLLHKCELVFHPSLTIPQNKLLDCLRNGYEIQPISSGQGRGGYFGSRQSIMSETAMIAHAKIMFTQYEQYIGPNDINYRGIGFKRMLQASVPPPPTKPISRQDLRSRLLSTYGIHEAGRIFTLYQTMYKHLYDHESDMFYPE